MNRRDFVSQAATVAGGVALLGLPQVSLAQAQRAGRVAPGEQQVMPLPFAAGSLKGISEQLITWHHDRHYAGYVKNRNDIERQLARMKPSADDFDAKHYGGLKRQLSFHTCGQILHENYFTVLGGDGQAGADSPVAQALRRDFGSLEAWRADLRATADAAGIGWGVTCYDRSSGRLVNYLVELHQNGAIWNAAPVVALDGWEHAYYRDYGPNKGEYLDAFFANLHWGRINAVYQAVAG